MKKCHYSFNPDHIRLNYPNWFTWTLKNTALFSKCIENANRSAHQLKGLFKIGKKIGWIAVRRCHGPLRSSFRRLLFLFSESVCGWSKTKSRWSGMTFTCYVAFMASPLETVSIIFLKPRSSWWPEKKSVSREPNWTCGASNVILGNGTGKSPKLGQRTM